ncbi:MAG: hypothetical protein JF597_23075 [Streptomyces sp.]|uniref:hypothetical protein n=1 Tax=Streptomyces sp. TaxID=1931 RepID=UPI0025F549E5|nr:hypothetical protein [Streptomyces sp.]MBW8796372.1 hypothetical protein [Streptomyces sp.]
MPGFGFCAWCRGYTANVRLINVEDQGSGSRQVSRYACPAHIRLRGLSPFSGGPADAPPAAAPPARSRP